MNNMSDPFIPLDNVRSLLQVVSDALDDRLAAYRKDTRYEAIRPSDVRVFVLAYREPRTISEIADIMKISRQSVHMSVHRLKQLGIVDLRVAADNRREKKVIITDSGEAARRTAQDNVSRLEKELEAILGADGLLQLRKLLLTLEDVLAPPHVARARQ